MTLSGRNRTFAALIGLSALCLLLGIGLSFVTVPGYGEETESTWQASGLIHELLARHFPARAVAAHFVAVALVLYSLLSLASIYIFFEKTQSPEIFFVAFFAFSFAPEVLRLVFPLESIRDFPPLYLMSISRAVLLSRYFGIFSLFVAGVHASGYQSQQQRTAIVIVLAASLFVAFSIPVDLQAGASGPLMAGEGVPIFRLLELGVYIITIASFLVAARSRGSWEFVPIGIGSALALLGRDILLQADSWAALPLGALPLTVGTWLICTRLHRIYLWL
ncbi:MAG: hypothetical protein FWD94_07345 [Treponema sp.]|nr:hypothetical protein [Treponema sp.]